MSSYKDLEPLEPLAIVGYSLKYPQDADTAEGFWKILVERRCVAERWPKERLNLDAFFHREDEKTVRGRWHISCFF